MPTTLADLSLDIVYMIAKEVHISTFERSIRDSSPALTNLSVGSWVIIEKTRC